VKTLLKIFLLISIISCYSVAGQAFPDLNKDRLESVTAYYIINNNNHELNNGTGFGFKLLRTKANNLNMSIGAERVYYSSNIRALLDSTIEMTGIYVEGIYNINKNLYLGGGLSSHTFIQKLDSEEKESYKAANYEVKEIIFPAVGIYYFIGTNLPLFKTDNIFLNIEARGRKMKTTRERKLTEMTTEAKSTDREIINLSSQVLTCGLKLEF
jgi:hypothetical protein